MSKTKTVLNLFFSMLKIGLFTFGGGYAMIPLLENEFVEKKKWMEKEDFLDMLAIAESTPGPIAINSATYIGYKAAGFFGALFATIGVCIPSFVIIFVISLFFDKFLSLTYVAYAFRGIQACVIYLILNAGLKMLKSIEKNAFNMTIMIATISVMMLFALFAVSFSTVFYILISGALGIIIYLIAKMRKSGKAAEK
ncbi:MAG: chromate transporter [Ruminococcaceae bacterium]|nr:chromate transporter [Oscillospiraceae bacterium]